MKNKELNRNQFRELIKKGLDLTFKKLLKSKQQSDGYFVFSENGEIKKVRARDITE